MIQAPERTAVYRIRGEADVLIYIPDGPGGIVTPEVKTGSRGQLLCDGCRACVYGYHCSACSARWRERATSRSQLRAHRHREAKRAAS